MGKLVKLYSELYSSLTKKQKVDFESGLTKVKEELAFLRALEDAGVDSWEGYDHAQYIYEEEYK